MNKKRISSSEKIPLSPHTHEILLKIMEKAGGHRKEKLCKLLIQDTRSPNSQFSDHDLEKVLTFIIEKQGGHSRRYLFKYYLTPLLEAYPRLSTSTLKHLLEFESSRTKRDEVGDFSGYLNQSRNRIFGVITSLSFNPKEKAELISHYLTLLNRNAMAGDIFFWKRFEENLVAEKDQSKREKIITPFLTAAVQDPDLQRRTLEWIQNPDTINVWSQDSALFLKHPTFGKALIESRVTTILKRDPLTNAFELPRKEQGHQILQLLLTLFDQIDTGKPESKIPSQFLLDALSSRQDTDGLKELFYVLDTFLLNDIRDFLTQKRPSLDRSISSSSIQYKARLSIEQLKRGVSNVTYLSGRLEKTTHLRHKIEDLSLIFKEFKDPSRDGSDFVAAYYRDFNISVA